MAKKETLGTFIKNFGKLDNKIQAKAIASWNVNTLLTMSKAQEYAIVKSGDLQGSARRVKARVTSTGFKSAFIFGMPYAHDIETATKTLPDGRVIELKQRSFFNPSGGFHYASRAVEKMTPVFMKDLDKIIGRVWDIV